MSGGFRNHCWELEPLHSCCIRHKNLLLHDHSNRQLHQQEPEMIPSQKPS